MVIFDLENLERECKKCGITLLEGLQYASNVYPPKNGKSKLIKFKKDKVLQGSSYILNLKDLIEDKDTSSEYKEQYIKLLARRDYSLFKMYQYICLNISYFPDMDHKAISSNPLLYIDKGKNMHFKHEHKLFGLKLRQK